MKARTFILTTGAALALVVPAAQAASTTNALQYQALVHTVQYDKNNHALGKNAAGKSRASKSHVKARQAIGQSRASASPVEGQAHQGFFPAPAGPTMTSPAPDPNTGLVPDESAPLESDSSN